MFQKGFTHTTAFLMVAVGLVGLATGYAVGTTEQKDTETEPTLTISPLDKYRSSAHEDVDFSLYWQLWDIIKEDYYKQPVNEVDLFYGSLAGLVAGLRDPYSIFLEPEVAQEFADELEGNFQGIGAEIGIKNDKLTIIAPLPDSPAEQAGLRPGDVILAIDGVDTAFLSIDEAVTLIRGDQGTEVVLTIFSQDDGRDSEDITIMRDVINVASVTWEELQEEDVFLITVNHFNVDTNELFEQAVLKMLSFDPDGIILDLRNNPGGLLDTAVHIAGYWTGGKIVVTERKSDGTENTYQAGNEPLLDSYTTVVLVNGGSASASEIVAGALKDYKLATIIGEQTFGKGTVQTLEELPDGSSIKLTIAEWLTPLGTLIEELGVTPDIVVELTEEDYNGDKDPQMDEAISFILNQ